MSRAERVYADRSHGPVIVPGAVPISEPIAGYYRDTLRGGAVSVGIRIWHGAPLDPITGEEMDRSWRWQAQCNGREIDLDRVWPKCAGKPIDAEEYAYLSSLQAWGEAHAPHSPEANPHKPVNWLTAPLGI